MTTDTLGAKELVDDRLMLFDVEASDWQDVVRQVSAKAEELGYVQDGYAQDVIDREKLYPTGLPCAALGVAVPHAITQEHVVKPTVAFARLAHPVAFKEMGDGEREVNVEAVFLLVAKGDEEHLGILQRLVILLSDLDFLDTLSKDTTAQAVAGLLREKLA